MAVFEKGKREGAGGGRKEALHDLDLGMKAGTGGRGRECGGGGRGGEKE